MYEQIREDTLYIMLYAVVTATALIASCYLLFCQGNAILSLRATKAIKITQTFELPLFGQLVANPASWHFYFIFGLTLKAI